MSLLREQMRAYLTESRVGVLSVSGGEGTWAMPVRYRAEDLELDCLVPAWADIAHHVAQRPDVLLVILSAFPSSIEERLRWLQFAGKARRVANPKWSGLLPRGVPEALADDLYLVLRVTPERIDLLDESRGWGMRETLEIEDTLSPGDDVNQ